jgi:hypothetical protein
MTGHSRPHAFNRVMWWAVLPYPTANNPLTTTRQ